MSEGVFLWGLGVIILSPKGGAAETSLGTSAHNQGVSQ